MKKKLKLSLCALFVGAMCSSYSYSATSNQVPDQPFELRTHDIQTPTNISQHPYFGWFMSDPDDNEMQSAYRIILSSDKSANLVVWDSGKVISSRQNFVYLPKNVKLDANKRYYWKVKLWDKNDAESNFSDVAKFDTGLFSNEDWHGANWIQRYNKNPDDYTYFRKKEKLNESADNIVRAITYISAVHHYELYLNGEIIGKGLPYHEMDHQYYDSFDVTNNLKKASDDITVGVLTHWFGKGQGRPGGHRGLISKTVIEFKDGTTQVIGSDSSWHTHQADKWQHQSSPSHRNRGEGVGYIEDIDGSRAIRDWQKPKFDDSKWRNASLIGGVSTSPWVNGVQPNLTKLIEKEIEPVSIKHVGNFYLVDFGKINTGNPKVTLNTTSKDKGKKVSLRGGDTLNTSGLLNRKSQNTDMRYSYTVAGTGKEVFLPFEFLGMRYLQISDNVGPITKKDVRFVERHFDLKGDVASFHSSNKTLNNVWELMEHSLYVGAQEEFLDTPTREKGGFLHDGWSQGIAAMHATGDRNMNLRVLEEFLVSQAKRWPDGRVNAVYPYSGTRDIPDFTQSYLVWVNEYYMQTGNKEFIKQNYAQFKKVADYVAGSMNKKTGLIENLKGGKGAYQYGIIDWPKDMRYGYDMKNKARTVINALAYTDFKIMSSLAHVAGHGKDAKKYADLAKKVKDAVNKNILTSKGYTDGTNGSRKSSHFSQQANALPMALDMVPSNRRKAVSDVIINKKMSSGMVTVRWLTEAIGKMENGPHLLELYTNKKWDGWAKNLEMGATATWEAWNSNKHPDQSLSHAWGAAGLPAMQEYILGLKPLTPQHSLVQIKPLDFKGKLKLAEGKIPTDRGMVHVSWKRETDSYKLAVDIPDNMKANVYVPKSGFSGDKLKVDGHVIKGTDSGNYLAIKDVGSGHHDFERKTNL